MLLRRYGIVVRDVLARSELASLARIAGVSAGSKTAAKFAADDSWMDSWASSLRCRWQWIGARLRRLDAAHERNQQQGSRRKITLSAADPLNLVGILVPGERVPAISGNSVTYRDGAAMAVAAIPVLAGNERL